MQFSLFILLCSSEIKYSKRRQSIKYNTSHKLMRPSIVRQILNSRDRLKKLKRISQTIYTETDDVGLGKNILLESDRNIGEMAYTKALRRYALEVRIILLW